MVNISSSTRIFLDKLWIELAGGEGFANLISKKILSQLTALNKIQVQSSVINFIFNSIGRNYHLAVIFQHTICKHEIIPVRNTVKSILC